MSSSNVDKKVKTLTEEAIKTLRTYTHSYITREFLERTFLIKRSTASKVVSALQKRQILGRPSNYLYDNDPVSRSTQFPINRHKL